MIIGTQVLPTIGLGDIIKWEEQDTITINNCLENNVISHIQ